MTPYFEDDPWLPQDHDELEVDYELMPKGCSIAVAIFIIIALIALIGVCVYFNAR